METTHTHKADQFNELFERYVNDPYVILLQERIEDIMMKQSVKVRIADGKNTMIETLTVTGKMAVDALNQNLTKHMQNNYPGLHETFVNTIFPDLKTIGKL